MPEESQYISVMPSTAPLTAEELLRINLPGKRTELVRGVLRVHEPAGYRHGDVAVRITTAIATFVFAHDLGRVFAAETGFTLARSPDTVRAPDAAFIRTARLLDRDTRGYGEIAPDLVVEVLSPDDRPGDVLEKVADWLKAGVSLVWLVDPVRRIGRVYRADGTQAMLDESSSFDGEDVLPGFTCGVSSILV